MEGVSSKDKQLVEVEGGCSLRVWFQVKALRLVYFFFVLAASWQVNGAR